MTVKELKEILANHNDDEKVCVLKYWTDPWSCIPEVIEQEDFELGFKK